MEERRTFLGYLKKIVMILFATFVGILVIVAIWGSSQPVTVDIAYVRGLLIGVVVGFILRSCLSKSK